MSYDRPYAPHEQRVIDEHREVSERLPKLTALINDRNPESIFDKLPSAERVDLMLQEHYMRRYQEILARRIARFKGETIPPLTDGVSNGS
jgi:hypothetical protein